MILAMLKGFKGDGDAFVDTLPFVVGRCRTANLIIPHVNVSRNHCHIIYEEFQWKIRNFSISGTYINGVLIDKDSSCALQKGDVINFSFPENNLSYTFYPLNLKCVNPTYEIRKTNQIFDFSKQPEISFGSNYGQQCNSRKKIDTNTKSNKNLIKPVKYKKRVKLPSVNAKEISAGVTSGKQNVSNLTTLEEEESINQRRKQLSICKDESNEGYFNYKGKILSPDENFKCVETEFIKCCPKNSKKIKLKGDTYTQTLLKKVSYLDETGLYSVLTSWKFPIEKSSEIKSTSVASLQMLKKNSTCSSGTECNSLNLNEWHGNNKKDINNSASLTEASNIEVFSLDENEANKELLKQFEEMKNALNDLKKKNSALLGKLAATTLRKQGEIAHIKSRVLQNFAELLENELQCTICSELFIKTITLGCTHSFCKFCIDQWKLKQKTCPICREKVTTETRSLVVDNYIEKVVEQLSVELKERRKAIVKERMESVLV